MDEIMRQVPKPMLRYYAKREGFLRWGVWYSYADDISDPYSGASEWRAVWGVRFWRWINAARIAQDLQVAHNAGIYAE